MARKPNIKDASGWTKSVFDHRYENIVIEVPTGLTVSNPQSEKRFSYVPEEIVLRNWFRLRGPGIRTKYYYGETAQSEVLADARQIDWDIECKKNNWS
jgi:hypothetical protein